MRRARLLLWVLALAVITSPAAGQETEGPTFQAFEGRTDSYAAGVATKQLSALPLPVEAFLTRTRTEINSQPRAQAYAGVVDIPLGELLGLYGFPSKLPTYCYADYPGENQASCGTAGGPVAAPEGMAAPRFGEGHTEVAGDGFNLDATAANSSVGVGRYASEQLTIGASTSASASRIVDGTLENVTEVVLSQVDIGGALTFEQIRASATALTNGLPGGAKAEAALTVSGISVGGQRVPIPGELDLSQLAEEVLAPMAEQLAANGVTVKVLQPPATEIAEDGRRAVASVAGLEIESSEPATGNRVGFTLGVARASAVAVRAGDAEGPADDEPGLDIPPAPVEELPTPGEQTPPPDHASANGSATPAGTAAPVEDASASPGSFTATPAYSDFGSGGSGFRSGSPSFGAGPDEALPAAGASGTEGATAPIGPTTPQPLAQPALPSAGVNPDLALAATREEIGERVADRLQLFYALAAAGIAVLGLLGFRLAHRARA